MKNLVVGFFCFIIASVALRDLTTLVLFNINQDFIASRLCINRDQPLLLCKGSCFLSDLVDQQKANPSTLSVHILDQLVLYVCDLIELPTQELSEIETKAISICTESIYKFDYLSHLFRPPIAVA